MSHHLSWFVAIDGKVLGPLTPGQLHVLVERGWVLGETPIRHERMRRWLPAKEVHGLPPLRDSLSNLNSGGVYHPLLRFIRLRDVVMFLVGAACALLAVMG